MCKQTASEMDRFWQYVFIPVDQNGEIDFDACWIWTRSADQKGYGWFRCKNKVWRANRFAYAVSHLKDPLKNGFVVCHQCDNPSCCNPFHLIQGTYQENMRQMFLRNRQKGPKLTAAMVLCLIRDHNNGHSVDDLARGYGIKNWQVQAILRGYSWGFVTHIALRPGACSRRSDVKRNRDRKDLWWREAVSEATVGQ